ncbi:MAG: Asp-tRNA(Asn)/Glu-tRNA(Gln) amidotransferase subunit GatC, partial [Daejeonella sp.]
MKIELETIDKIAHLARLEVNETEKLSLQKDMTNILTFMDKLNELDTDGVEPLIYMTDEVNVLRNDEVKNDLSTADALKNAPKHDGKFFR